MPPPPSFLSKKAKILAALSIPATEYDDLSPKGSVDVGIRELIDEINAEEGWVTTSSCAGRVSVFLEGVKATDELGEEEARETTAKIGGKGGGGRWLFVSHDPVYLQEDDDFAGKLGMERGSVEEVEKRLVRFKFEPMILHVLTSSLDHAQSILSCALQAGFRESGALNLLGSGKERPTPIVAVRCMGLAMESVVGVWSGEEAKCIVPHRELKMLLEVANERFIENRKRIARFRELLRKAINVEKRKGDLGEWEDEGARRERKRAEGLRKKELFGERKSAQDEVNIEGLGLLNQNT